MKLFFNEIKTKNIYCYRVLGGRNAWNSQALPSNTSTVWYCNAIELPQLLYLQYINNCWIISINSTFRTHKISTCVKK